MEKIFLPWIIGWFTLIAHKLCFTLIICSFWSFVYSFIHSFNPSSRSIHSHSLSLLLFHPLFPLSFHPSIFVYLSFCLSFHLSMFRSFHSLACPFIPNLTLAIEIVCCSMASWIATLSSSRIYKIDINQSNPINYAINIWKLNTQ